MQRTTSARGPRAEPAAAGSPPPCRRRQEAGIAGSTILTGPRRRPRPRPAPRRSGCPRRRGTARGARSPSRSSGSGHRRARRPRWRSWRLWPSRTCRRPAARRRPAPRCRWTPPRSPARGRPGLATKAEAVSWLPTVCTPTPRQEPTARPAGTIGGSRAGSTAHRLQQLGRPGARLGVQERGGGGVGPFGALEPGQHPNHEVGQEQQPGGAAELGPVVRGELEDGVEGQQLDAGDGVEVVGADPLGGGPPAARCGRPGSSRAATAALPGRRAARSPPPIRPRRSRRRGPPPGRARAPARPRGGSPASPSGGCRPGGGPAGDASGGAPGQPVPARPGRRRPPAPRSRRDRPRARARVRVSQAGGDGAAAPLGDTGVAVADSPVRRQRREGGAVAAAGLRGKGSDIGPERRLEDLLG